VGFRESRRCSRDTYPESYINEYILIYEEKGGWVVRPDSAGAHEEVLEVHNLFVDRLPEAQDLRIVPASPRNTQHAAVGGHWAPKNTQNAAIGGHWSPKHNQNASIGGPSA